MEPRVKLYVPREESLPVPLKYIDVTRTTHSSQDVLLEKHIDDCWNVDGERELSNAWNGRIFMVPGETDEETNDLKTRQCMARHVETYV